MSKNNPFIHYDCLKKTVFEAVSTELLVTFVAGTLCFLFGKEGFAVGLILYTYLVSILYDDYREMVENKLFWQEFEREFKEMRKNESPAI